MHERQHAPPPAYSYLLGMYLGDGHIAELPRTARLRIFLDSRYPRIVAACVAAARLCVPARRTTAARQRPHNLVIVSSYSMAWPCLLPQHGPGVKHERRIELEDWQREITYAEPEAFIRGLIHSDGCRFINPVNIKGRRYEYPRYLFSNRSSDIRGLFTEHLDLLRIPWRPVGRWNVSVARKEGVAALDAFVGPKR